MLALSLDAPPDFASTGVVDDLPLLGMVIVPFVIGRILLSMLPAGRPGAHIGPGLATTWAASHVLGLLGIAAQVRIAALLEWEPGWSWSLPWLVLLGLRRATLPGSMVAGHEPAREIPPKRARLVLAFAILLALWIAFQERVPGELVPGSRLSSSFVHMLTWAFGLRVAGSLFHGCLVVALLTLMIHGLGTARRRPLAREAIVLLVGLPALALAWRHGLSLELELALFIGSGAVFSIAWLRRADRRAAWLSTLSFAGCALVSPESVVFALGGLIALVVATPSPSRARITRGAIISLAIAATLGHGPWPKLESESQTVFVLSDLIRELPYTIGWLAVALSLVIGLTRAMRPVEMGDVARPGRELAAAWLVLLVSVVWIFRTWLPGTVVTATIALGPLMALIAGLSLLPAERPAHRA